MTRNVAAAQLLFRATVAIADGSTSDLAEAKLILETIGNYQRRSRKSTQNVRMLTKMLIDRCLEDEVKFSPDDLDNAAFRLNNLAA